MITITEEAKKHLIKVLDSQSKPIVLFGLKGGGCAGFEYSWDTYNEDEYTENKSTVASIGYNEPSLVFEVGTNIKVFKSIEKFSENFSLFDYLIIEKDYYIEFNKINEAKLKHKKISSLIGFNAAKGQWIEIYLLKKL